MEYVLLLLNIVLAIAASSVSLSLLVKDGGMLSLAHAAFVGIGAYTWAILVVRFGVHGGAALLGVGAIGLIAGGIFSLFLARLEADAFVLGTVAVQLGCTSVLRNWREVTNGNLGISLAEFSPAGTGSVTMLLILAAIAVIGLGLSLQFVRTIFPCTILHAIRDDPVLAETLGRDSRWARVVTLSASSCAGALGGAIYGRVIGFLHPDAFSLNLSLLLLTVVILSGRADLLRLLAGAFFVITVPELLRFLPIDESVRANLRQVLYNLALASALSWAYIGRKRDSPSYPPKRRVSP